MDGIYERTNRGGRSNGAQGTAAAAVAVAVSNGVLNKTISDGPRDDGTYTVV